MSAKEDWSLERLEAFRISFVKSYACNCKKPKPPEYWNRLDEIDRLIKLKKDVQSH